MRQKIRIGILASIMLFGIGTAWAGDASYPLVAMTMPRYHVTMRNGRFRADPPPDPTFLNQQQILNQILDLTHGALIVEATASGAPGSPTTFYATDQIFNKVFDAANTALVVNCISGCSGGGGGATLQTNGSSNSSQIVLNFETSTANSAGLTITPSNPSGGIEKFEISGGSYSGNAATATALAATPSQCSGSNFATGIAASGNANCSTPSPTHFTSFPSRVYLAAAGCNNATAENAWDIPTATAAVPACVTASNVQQGVLQFAQSAAAQTTLELPTDWNAGAINATLWFSIVTDTTSGHTAIFNVAFSCAQPNNNVVDNVAFNAATAFATVTIGAGATANSLYSTTASGITTTGCAAGYLMHVALSRAASDTVTDSNIEVKGMELNFGRTF